MTNELQKSMTNLTGSEKTSMPKLSASDRLQILKLLRILFPMQKRYGTTEQEVEYIVEGWAIRLNGYKIKDILAAAWKYTETYSDIPTPANIINIINHGYPEPRDNRYVAPTQRPI